MTGPLSFLGGPFKGIIEGIGGVIDKLSTTDEEKLHARRELLEIERDFQVKVLEVDALFAAEQAKVITAETNSQSWLARNWRPIVMLEFGFIIGWNYILVPILGAAFHITTVPIVPDMWELLKLGMGGYIVGRSAEKIVPLVTDAYIQGKNKK